MPAWPGTLPAKPQYSNSGENMALQCIYSTVTSGPPKKRRITTTAYRTWTMAWLMTKAQVAAFETFYYTDCFGGSISFTMTHPRTGTASISWRFSGEPSIDPAAPDYYLVSASLEQLST